MSKYDMVPRRMINRTTYRCDFCNRDVLKDERRCSLGMFESCKDCEHLLVGRYTKWREGAVVSNAHARRALNQEQVTKLLILSSEGWTHQRLADKFKVSTGVVGRIVRGESYKDAV